MSAIILTITLTCVIGFIIIAHDALRRSNRDWFLGALFFLGIGIWMSIAALEMYMGAMQQ